MPSASDELRDQMKEWFGDAISDEGPTKFLTEAGYKLRRDWLWEPKSGVTNYEQMTQKEFECMMFLVHEWDFGGLIGGRV